MGLADLFEAGIRHPIESLVTAVIIMFLVTLYNSLRPEDAGGPFANEFDTILATGILSIKLLAALGTVALFILAWKTFAEMANGW